MSSAPMNLPDASAECWSLLTWLEHLLGELGRPLERRVSPAAPVSVEPRRKALVLLAPEPAEADFLSPLFRGVLLSRGVLRAVPYVPSPDSTSTFTPPDRTSTCTPSDSTSTFTLTSTFTALCTMLRRVSYSMRAR